jgi:hypothetical protein
MDLRSLFLIRHSKRLYVRLTCAGDGIRAAYSWSSMFDTCQAHWQLRQKPQPPRLSTASVSWPPQPVQAQRPDRMCLRAWTRSNTSCLPPGQYVTEAGSSGGGSPNDRADLPDAAADSGGASQPRRSSRSRVAWSPCRGPSKAAQQAGVVAGHEPGFGWSPAAAFALPNHGFDNKSNEPSCPQTNAVECASADALVTLCWRQEWLLTTGFGIDEHDLE